MGMSDRSAIDHGETDQVAFIVAAGFGMDHCILLVVGRLFTRALAGIIKYFKKPYFKKPDFLT
jgi:hypothetical protein